MTLLQEAVLNISIVPDYSSLYVSQVTQLYYLDYMVVPKTRPINFVDCIVHIVQKIDFLSEITVCQHFLQ